ncbi:MAG: hypothetical protein Q8Q67_00055 [bacterium]|nr:hypothetical protein [bacterium]
MVFQAKHQGQLIVFTKENIFTERSQIIVKKARICLGDDNTVFKGYFNNIEVCFSRGNVFLEAGKAVVRHAKSCDENSNRAFPTTILLSELTMEVNDLLTIQQLLTKNKPVPGKILLSKLQMSPKERDMIIQLQLKRKTKRPKPVELSV